MNLLQRSKLSAAWQKERAAKLQRTCRTIKAAVQRGDNVKRVIRRLSRWHHGRPFRCDPARRLQLRPSTLRRLWDQWKQAGELPTAFKLNYYRHPSAMTAPVLVRFTDYCAKHPHRSLRAAWLKFIRRPGALGAHTGMTVSYDMLHHNYLTADFYQLQEYLATIRSAKQSLASLGRKIKADVRRRLPARAPRQRSKSGGKQ